MQKKTLRKGVLLAGALAFTLSMAAQQARQTPGKLRPTEISAAVLFNFEREQVARVGEPTFWLRGGSADASLTFWKGVGLAANLTGEHASNIASQASLGKIAFMAGPRYTFDTSKFTGRMTKKRHTEIFGEWLFGGTHAFDSTFPGFGNVQTSANAFSMQAGGGVDISLAKGFGIRAFEMDWIHTRLPNNASNSQNGFRIAFGASWRR